MTTLIKDPEIVDDIPDGWYSAEFDGEERMCYKFTHAEGYPCLNVFYAHVLRLVYLATVEEGTEFTPIAITRLHKQRVIYSNEDEIA